jgi:hypothetical protein
MRMRDQPGRSPEGAANSLKSSGFGACSWMTFPFKLHNIPILPFDHRP